MVLNPDEILRLPDQIRKSIRLDLKSKRKRGIRRRTPVKSPEFTRAELIDYIRKNNFRKLSQVFAASGNGRPTLWCFQKNFGTSFWSKVKQEAFSPDSIRFKWQDDIDAGYLMKLVLEFDLWTRDKYEKARLTHPSIVPPLNRIREKWGTFRRMKICARRYSIKIMLDEYLKLSRRLGRIPSVEDCKENGVYIDKAVEFFKGKKYMDMFLQMMEKKDATKERST